MSVVWVKRVVGGGILGLFLGFAGIAEGAPGQGPSRAIVKIYTTGVERASDEPFVVFTLGNGSRVTIDRSRAVATGSEVLARYEVAADRSPRLRSLAQARTMRADAAGAQLAN